ncbi:hypothetical protein FF38_07498 [Lucilia cuprina]|uniref:Uncharacterized protein n=1 Tax=Lucilia cuprina TaxID=7375 RepID=A0A0L0CEZ1_LUCCU|nr:hypothetical protein FF38_07498 [Lucilia cuprina]
MAVGYLNNVEVSQHVATSATADLLPRHESRANDNLSSSSRVPSNSHKHVDSLEKPSQISAVRDSSASEDNVPRQHNDIHPHGFNIHSVQHQCVNCQSLVRPSFPPIAISNYGYPSAFQNKPNFKPHYVSNYDGSTSWTDYERQVEDAARF